jgi:hypothetical protein
MKIQEAISIILQNPEKSLRARNKPYIIKQSSTGGISIIKQRGKCVRTNTFDLTGEHVVLEWEEIRKPINSVEALSIKDKRIRPVGNFDFATSEEWLLSICENRQLLRFMWEVE